MRALRFSTFGDPSVLSVDEVAIPEPRNDEALVRVTAAAINPSDVKNVSGYFKQTTLPRTPGRDFSGVVVQGTKYLGEEVWASAPGSGFTRDGAHAEYVVVPIEVLSPKPRNLSVEQAAAIGVPFITAWVSLVREAKLQPGETILIIGAGGAVGQAATQIANLLNARVLGAVRNAVALPGTAAMINTQAEDIAERARALTDGRGVDVVLNTVGGAMFEPALKSLRPGGRQVVIASTGDRRVSFDLIDFYHNSSRLIGVDATRLTSAEVGAIANELNAGFESNRLKVPPIETVPFGKAVEAYTRVAQGHGGRKQVLMMESTSGNLR